MYIAIVDVIIVAIIAFLALRCAFKGFVSEFLSMAALVIGLLIAIFFFRKVAVIVGEQFEIEVQLLAEIISFAILFIAIFVAIKLVESLLKNIITKIKLTGLDRFLGFFYGMIEGIVVVYLLLFLVNLLPNSENILGRSALADKLLQFITGNFQDVVESIVWLRIPLVGMYPIV